MNSNQVPNGPDLCNKSERLSWHHSACTQLWISVVHQFPRLQLDLIHVNTFCVSEVGLQGCWRLLCLTFPMWMNKKDPSHRGHPAHSSLIKESACMRSNRHSSLVNRLKDRWKLSAPWQIWNIAAEHLTCQLTGGISDVSWLCWIAGKTKSVFVLHVSATGCWCCCEVCFYIIRARRN